MKTFEILIKHFADYTKNVNIVWTDENEAKTDGNTIYLPKNIPERGLFFLLHFLLHEAFHIKHNSNDMVKSIIKAILPSFYSPLCSVIQTLINIYEDIRIDGLVFKKYKYAPIFYKKVYEFCQKEIWLPKFQNNKKLINLFKQTKNCIYLVEPILDQLTQLIIIAKQFDNIKIYRDEELFKVCEENEYLTLDEFDFMCIRAMEIHNNPEEDFPYFTHFQEVNKLFNLSLLKSKS